jgi:hypothetical protein
VPTGPVSLALRERLRGDVNIRTAAQLREYGSVIDRIAADRTLPGELASRLSGAVWALNRPLARVRLLNLLSTNVELIATRR